MLLGLGADAVMMMMMDGWMDGLIVWGWLEEEEGEEEEEEEEEEMNLLSLCMSGTDSPVPLTCKFAAR